jgi:hypothetical protein
MRPNCEKLTGRRDGGGKREREWKGWWCDVDGRGIIHEIDLDSERRRTSKRSSIIRVAIFFVDK